MIQYNNIVTVCKSVAGSGWWMQKGAGKEARGRGATGVGRGGPSPQKYFYFIFYFCVFCTKVIYSELRS